MKTKQLNQTFGLCIDWETSGTTWNKDSSIDHQGISYGAVVFKLSDFSVVETLYREVKFDSSRYKWADSAEAIHGLSREHLEINGVTQEEAAVALAEMILKYWGPKTKVMFLGHNALFDIRFTNQLFNEIGIEFSIEQNTKHDSWIELHHVVLDTASVGFVNFGVFKSDLLFDRLGFPERGSHNALEDALQTVEACKIIRAITNEVLNGN